MKKSFGFGIKSFFSIQNSPLIIGVCIGIAVNLVFTPYLQNSCIGLTADLADGVRFSHVRDIRSNNDGDPVDDFEPIINLEENIEIKKDDNQQQEKPVRPRYYSTELGMRDKVLISAISTKESIGSFAIAMNKTLSHYVDKVIFFLDGAGSKKFGLNIPIVGFKEPKPLIAIFRILSYISENYIEDFDYFMFVTDHTYINGKQLMNILEQISVSQNVHMGNLQDTESLYCNLESGIILSQAVLEAVSKELLWCTKHAFSDSVSDNFGRCILHATNLPCKAIYQAQFYKSYNLQGRDNELASLMEQRGSSNLGIKNAVAIKNVQQSNDFYRLHIHSLQEFILQTKEEIFNLRDSVKTTLESSPLNIPISWPAGSINSHIPPTRHDLLPWETFNATHIFMPSSVENVKPLSGIDLLDITSVIDASVSHLETKTHTPLVYETLRYGHRRFDPTRGMDYILSLVFRDGNDRLVYKRTEAFRGLTMPEIVPVPYVTENVRINIVVFIEKADVSTALNFVERHDKKLKLEMISLTFFLLYDQGDSYLSKDDPYKSLKDRLKDFTRQFYSSESRATFHHITVPNGRPNDFALIDLAVKKFPANSMLFICSLHANFDTTLVNRIRLNTIFNWQVFSPIPFALYHRDLVESIKSYEKQEIKSKNGHFDKYDFSQISFYVEDYTKARKLISDQVPIIRTEKDLERPTKTTNLTVYKMFLLVKNLHVLRAIDPNLVMPYRPLTCPAGVGNNSSENGICEIRQSLSLGERHRLSKLVFEYMRDNEIDNEELNS